MKRDEAIDFILKSINNAQYQTINSFELNELLINEKGNYNNNLIMISDMKEYLVSTELIKREDLGFNRGEMLTLTKESVQILHKYGSYSKFQKKEKSFFKDFKPINAIPWVIALISLAWGIYRDVTSREKDNEIKQLKNELTEQKHYIQEMRKTIIEKDAIIDVYNRSNPPTAKTDK